MAPIKRWTQPTITNNTSYQSDNLPFGDNIESSSDSKCFLFHNINGLKDDTNWVQINQTMQELKVTGFGMSETNTTF
jgi:hypothetical protein